MTKIYDYENPISIRRRIVPYFTPSKSRHTHKHLAITKIYLFLQLSDVVEMLFIFVLNLNDL
jgi:hypothetical protein